MLKAFTFPRSRRLLKRRDFMRVLKNGKRIGNQQLSFAVLENTETNESRLGLALAKRFIKQAVDRNQIKRQVREAFRQAENLPVVDIVVLTRKSTDIHNLPAIRKAADELLKRLSNK